MPMQAPDAKQLLIATVICLVASPAWWYWYLAATPPLPGYPAAPQHPPTALTVDPKDETEWQQFDYSNRRYNQAYERMWLRLMVPSGVLALAAGGFAFAASLHVVKTRPWIGWAGIAVSIAYWLAVSAFLFIAYGFRHG